MTTNTTVHHCKAPNPVTYETISWLTIGEFTLGLPLNLSVLYIFIFKFMFWNNKSLFLFNIVVADFLLVACLPAKAYHYQKGLRQSKNKVVCKTLFLILGLNRAASIAFLITLSIHRYFSVVHLGRGNFAKVLKETPQHSIVIWLLLLTLTIPTMFRSFECCTDHIHKPGPIDIYIEVIIPYIILVFCIINRLRKKTVGEKTKLRKAVWVVLSVVFVFSLCFLPCTTAKAMLLSVRLKDWHAEEDVVIQIFNSLKVLSYTDCLLDPLVYCFCNSGFKNAYIFTFCPTFLQERLFNSDIGMRAKVTTTPTSQTRTISLPIVEKGFVSIKSDSPTQVFSATLAE